MNRRAAVATILGVVLLAVALLVVQCWRGRGTAIVDTKPSETTDGALRALPFDLYFPSTDGVLVAERRQLEVGDSALGRARALIEVVLSGPESAGLVRPFGEDVGLGRLYGAADGVLYLELVSTESERPPASGSEEEMLRVFSLVNSISLNVPEVRRVVLLWNGAQLESFGGHLDTSRPLAPNRSLIAE